MSRYKNVILLKGKVFGIGVYADGELIARSCYDDKSWRIDRGNTDILCLVNVKIYPSEVYFLTLLAKDYDIRKIQRFVIVDDDEFYLQERGGFPEKLGDLKGQYECARYELVREDSEEDGIFAKVRLIRIYECDFCGKRLRMCDTCHEYFEDKRWVKKVFCEEGIHTCMKCYKKEKIKKMLNKVIGIFGKSNK